MNKAYLFFALVVLVVVPHGSMQAQPIGCDADDYRCVENEHVLACREPESSLAACIQWLRRLEGDPQADHPNSRLIAGTTYIRLAELATSSSDAQEFRERGRAIYRELVSQDPSNAQALLGLSSTSEDVEEAIVYLRQAVAADPDNAIAIDSLARYLAQQGQVQQAAQVYEYAYERMDARGRWQMAERALSMHARAGDTQRVESLRSRVRNDMNVVGIERDLASIGFRDAAHAAEVIPELCYEPAMGVIGASPCLGAISSAVNAAIEGTSSEEREALADAAANGMIAAGRRENTLWARLQSEIEALLEQDIRTATLYDAYANFVPDPDMQLSALEEAAALAPNNGQQRYRLALRYFERGMWSQAVSEFRAARPLLPDWRHPVLDQFVEQGEAAMETRQ